jgi:hypothetical protein
VTPPLGIFGFDVGELVEDAVRALVDLVVPDFGSQWVSSLVTWLVALPPVTGSAFPSLNQYAGQLTAVGFGLLGACFLGGLLQLWAGGASGATGAEAIRRAAIGAGALATYTTVLQSLLLGVNILTAEMIRHPLVVDGLDKAFGESLTVAAVTGGVSLGLAIGAALAVLYFVAALFVLKIGLTALLAVSVVAGALVWGVYPLPQAQWLARAWLSGLVAAIAVPIAWACMFASAALLARDTLVFEGGGQFNAPLGETLGYLVKPFAAVACFWIAYRAPYFLLGAARGMSAALSPGGNMDAPGAGTRTAAARTSRGVASATARFRSFFVSAPSSGSSSGGRRSGERASGSSRRRSPDRPATTSSHGAGDPAARVTPSRRADRLFGDAADADPLPRPNGRQGRPAAGPRSASASSQRPPRPRATEQPQRTDLPSWLTELDGPGPERRDDAVDSPNTRRRSPAEPRRRPETATRRPRKPRPAPDREPRPASTHRPTAPPDRQPRPRPAPPPKRPAPERKPPKPRRPPRDPS